MSKPRDPSNARVVRSKTVQIVLGIGLIAAGGLASYGLSRSDPSPGPNAPEGVNIVEASPNGTAVADANTRGTADIALPPVPVAITTP